MKTQVLSALILVLGLSTDVFAQSKDSDKLDLKKLEDKYWSAKDTDFSVVQNRMYTKANRYFLSVSYGPLINDEWNIGRMTNLAAGFYFSERWGVEVARETGSLKDNELIPALFAQGGSPNYNKFVSYTSVNGIWVPFYAKMSFLDRAIVYFDMQFAIGLGQLNYQSQIDPIEGPHQDKSVFAYNFDFTQQLFFSEHWAVRLDLKNKWSKQELRKYHLGAGTDRDMGTKSQQDTSLLFGLTYFF